jgi:G6PDH family F420-dependent oxidoreductase
MASQSSPSVGYMLSSELHEPSALVEQARRAEDAGFDYVALSDHFHPWVSAQGHAPFAWTVLGGVAEVTEDIPVGTAVTAPIVRYHPAIVAQAAATAASMLDGRFFYGVGTGENLNESVVGEGWPAHPVRLDMLAEAVDVTRKLWTGETVTHHGDHYTVKNARLYTVPDEEPPIVVSAYGEKTARAAGEFGDGFVTVGPQGTLVETYRDAGGDGPVYGQMTVSYEDSRDAAVASAYERWPTAALEGQLNTELANPGLFEDAVETVTREDIAEGSTVVEPNPDAHLESVREFADAGFDHVTIHDVGADTDGFFEFYESAVLPELG